MPAYFESGFSVREPMWHGMGTVLDDYPESWDDARRVAGLMWEPTGSPAWNRKPATSVRCLQCEQSWGSTHKDTCPITLLSDPMPTPVTSGDCGEKEVITVGDDVFVLSGFQLISRDDTGDALGVVSDKWREVTHAQMGEMVEALIGIDGHVKFETAGVLRGGRSVWALAYLDEPYTVPGDESQTYPYFAMLNHHDGSGAAKILPTQVRVVCWNTFSAASSYGEQTGRQVVIRHTGDVSTRIEEAKASLANLRADVVEYRELAEDLSGINVNDALVRTFLERFIPTPENATERTLADRRNRQATFMALYEQSPTTDGIRGTAYGVLQTATEYLDHLRPFRSKDTYLSRTMLRPEPLKARTVSLVRELVKANA